MSNNPIYDLMYKGESGAAGYNAWNRGTGNNGIRPATHDMDFSQLSLGEVQRMQHLNRNDPDFVFAIGKYQIIPATMDAAVRTLKLDPNERFTPELQNRIFSEYLLRTKQPGIAPYIMGKSDNLQAAMEGLSNEWASFSDPRKGDMRSHYGSGNNAHISLAESESALQQLRQQFRHAKDLGASDTEAWRTATAVSPSQHQTVPGSPRADGAGSMRTEGAMADGVLKNGDRGAEVQSLQAALNALGYRGRNGEHLETTSGVFGAETKYAVEAFQRSHGLPIDGKAGRETLPALAMASEHPLLSEASHPNHRLYAELARQLPAGTKPEVAANVTLQALENGVNSVDKLSRVDVRGSDVFVMGTTPGDRVRVDLQAPTPSLQQMSDFTREQAEQQSPQRTPQPQAGQLQDVQEHNQRTMLA